MPQRVLATGPLPSARSSSAITHRVVHGFIGTMRPSEYSYSYIVRPERLPPLHARDPPLCVRRRFRVSMSPPMFQGWLCIHKKVLDHGGGRYISHTDVTPVAFGVKGNTSASTINTLFGVQYFLWMLAVYASPPPSPVVDARLATGLRAADFPDRTFTGKSTSALHGALPSHRRPGSQVL